jgi:hypothetical protein
MNKLTASAHAAMAPLLGRTEEELFQELGLRLQAVADDPERGGVFNLAVAPSPFESAIDYGEIGHKFFANLSSAAYNVLCGSADGHQQIQSVADKGIDTVAATIAAILVAHLGLAAAVAAALGAVIVKLFYSAGTKTLCEAWKGAPQKKSELPRA